MPNRYFPIGKEAFEALPHEVFSGPKLLIPLGGEDDPIEHARVPNKQGTTANAHENLDIAPR